MATNTGVFVGGSTSQGFNPDISYPVDTQHIFGFRAGSTVVGVDGYTYTFRIATADLDAATSGVTNGVLNGEGYWFRGNSLGTGSVTPYATTYPANSGATYTAPNITS